MKRKGIAPRGSQFFPLDSFLLLKEFALHWKGSTLKGKNLLPKGTGPFSEGVQNNFDGVSVSS